jgi:hypothetical protein
MVIMKKKIPYNEKTLAINLVNESYKNLNPFELIQKAKEDLDVILTIQDIQDYLQVTEDFEMESNKIEIGYNTYEYE